MFIPAHWNVRYLFDRVVCSGYQLLHPGSPWFTPQAIAYLENVLTGSEIGFEWGSGRSTIWFTERVQKWFSVENDEEWYEKVRHWLSRKGFRPECVYLAHYEHEYVVSITKFEKNSFDIVVVDGISETRDKCALTALEYLKPGGMILIDDIHRYLPSESRSPRALKTTDAPLTPLWTRFKAQVSSWEKLWTSSGVTDTAIWFRPLRTH